MSYTATLERLEADVELWRIPHPSEATAGDLFTVKDPARAGQQWGPMAWDEAIALFDERVRLARG
jgi:hypothetical protein